MCVYGKKREREAKLTELRREGSEAGSVTKLESLALEDNDLR